MPGVSTRLGVARLAAIVGLSALTLGIGLGSSGRLTYHEAFVAQAAREMVAGGSWLIPTIDGQPWLEKPPLATWLVALLGGMAGGVTEFVARAPSAVAATLLALGVAVFAARRFGRDVGWLAGLIQATTFWFVVRGRLAEADILLACLVTWTFVAFDRIRAPDPGPEAPGSARAIRGPHPARTLARALRVGAFAGRTAPASNPAPLAPVARVEDEVPRPDVRVDLVSPRVAPASAWRWAFFGALGATSLVKGVGFGAVLVLSAVVVVLIWDRDRAAARALLRPKGWALAGILALTWPVLVAIRLPAAVSLWALHVTDRLASRPEVFIGGPWWQYGPAALGQALPWTPLALLGAWRSIGRTLRGRGGADRLLWAWAVLPVLVLSAATVKNGHYAIHALPPLAVWAALGLFEVGRRLEARRGWTPGGIQLGAAALFAGLGLAWGVGHLTLGPRFDRRGGEWAWCESLGRSLDPALPLVVLYEDWDRKPYPTPFGPVPHDWAVRLFYLGRPASWRQGVDDLATRPPGKSAEPFALLGRERDRPALARIGRVEALGKGPADRFDREFVVDRVTPPAR